MKPGVSLLITFIEWLLSKPERTSDWDWLGDLEARNTEEEQGFTEIVI